MIELEFDNAFQARHLAVPISQAFSVAQSDNARDAETRLREERFDQAPVVDGDRMVGFVLTRHLARAVHVAEVMTPLGSGNVVSADASVGRLMEWILDPGFLFVLEGREITGFITVSDFIKQPARGYLYLALSRLEIGLAALVRRRFPDHEQACALLMPQARGAVVRRFQADRAAGTETEQIAYFGFLDLIRVFGADITLRRLLGKPSGEDWLDAVKGFVQLRNDVMHPIRNVDLAKDGLIRLQNTEQRVRALIETVEQAIADELTA